METTAAGMLLSPSHKQISAYASFCQFQLQYGPHESVMDRNFKNTIGRLALDQQYCTYQESKELENPCQCPLTESLKFIDNFLNQPIKIYIIMYKVRFSIALKKS